MSEKTRRDMLKAPVGVAAAIATSSNLLAATVSSVPTIQIPKEIPATLGEAARAPSFEGNGMTGAEVFAKLCKEEELAALFCCPGNYTVINALAAVGIPSYGGRSEGAMCAAADGFSRVTGEVTACSGTEGPGFTNMIMNIASAAAARTPLLVLASNMQLAGDDREAFIQTGYQQPLTTGMKKYGKRLIAADRIHEYGAYAFRNLKSGVPGPVHLDFPGEVARARFTDPANLKDYYDKTKYRTESRAHPAAKDVQRAVEMIGKAERPIIVAGQGVFQRKAWDLLKAAAEKQDIAVPVRNGVARFKLLWHRNRFFDFILDVPKRALRIAVVFPNVPADSSMYAEFRRFVASRQAGDLPAHRRIDREKAAVRCLNRGGNVSLTLDVLDGDYAYGTRKLIQLVHEVYMSFLIDGPYLEYMVEAFQLDPDRI